MAVWTAGRLNACSHAPGMKRPCGGEVCVSHLLLKFGSKKSHVCACRALARHAVPAREAIWSSSLQPHAPPSPRASSGPITHSSISVRLLPQPRTCPGSCSPPAIPAQGPTPAAHPGLFFSGKQIFIKLRKRQNHRQPAPQLSEQYRPREGRLLEETKLQV